MTSNFWFRFKSRIPRSPGVYIFKNRDGGILYIGKAIDLYHRVASYFQRPQNTGSKQKSLVDQIADMQTIVVESELEALILEANLIKKNLPPFNVRLIDDKDFLYITVSKEVFPEIVTARKKDLRLAKKYWGPFPSSKTVRSTLKLLRKVFPWCSNPPKKAGVVGRPCFYYHLRLCPGACVGLISQKDYNKIINRFAKFMDGRKQELIGELLKEMVHYSRDLRFEEAAKIKKVLEGIEYMTQTNRIPIYLENPNFLAEEQKTALIELKKDLGLEKLPRRIEGYDISNIQGKEATGSMVVLTNGEIDKSQYRKFKIRPPSGRSGKPNDVGMMREIIRRRFTHKEWPVPDLILVDGGKPQVNGVKLEIKNLFRQRRFEKQLEIPLFGLAKRMELLYPSEGEALKLPRKSLSLKLLQKLRDEAHRFAVSYYRKLHQRSNLNII